MQGVWLGEFLINDSHSLVSFLLLRVPKEKRFGEDFVICITSRRVVGAVVHSLREASAASSTGRGHTRHDGLRVRTLSTCNRGRTRCWQ